MMAARVAAPWPLAALLALVAASAPGSAGEPSLEARRAARRADAEAAARDVRATFLFADGRGVHSLPGLHAPLRLARGLLPGPTTAYLRDTLGLVVDAQGVAGLHEVGVDGHSVPVLGCAACHTGRAAGRTVVGLGNKRIDVGAVGRAVLDLALAYRLTEPLLGASGRGLVRRALALARLLTDPRVTNRTQGLVPTALVATWFLRARDPCAPPQAIPAAVKVPHLWGYGEKRSVGSFCDGLGDGRVAGWGAMVEATAGQRPETIRAYLPKVEALEATLDRLLPPRFPLPVDPAAAARGAVVFAGTCARCHGRYERDGDGFPRFEAPLHVPWEEVGTDDERLRVRTPQLLHGIDTSPLADVVRRTRLPPGYFAPRLDGVWARFPYLHNGSVPSLRALLTPPESRPEAFSLQDAGEAWRFDALGVGLTVPGRGSAGERRLLEAARRGARHVFWAARPGQSNRGHPFGTALSAAEKQDLLAFLETL